MFLIVCRASPRNRECKYSILSSSVSWFWILSLVWIISSNGSIFFDFSSLVGIAVVKDLGRFEIRLMLLLELAELLLLANCWKAKKIWSASIVAGVFSLRNCGWLVDCPFFVEGSHRSNGRFLPELLSHCESPRLGLNQLVDWTDRLRIQLQDEDFSGNDHKLVADFQRLQSGMFPERFRIVSVLED